MAKDKPFFSVLVTVCDESAHLLTMTLESASAQDMDCEVLLIQKGNPFAALNEAIKVAKGEYIHILQAGEFYLTKHALQAVKKFIEEQDLPDLVQAGCIVRHCYGPPQVLFQKISRKNLRLGRLPQSLQAYWMRRKSLLGMGGFNPRYRYQAGFELLCRIYASTSLRKAFLKRVMTDSIYQRVAARSIIWSAEEMLVIMYQKFGLTKALFGWLWVNTRRLAQFLLARVGAMVSKKN